MLPLFAAQLGDSPLLEELHKRGAGRLPNHLTHNHPTILNTLGVALGTHHSLPG
jgi:hypothetical protein